MLIIITYPPKFFQKSLKIYPKSFQNQSKTVPDHSQNPPRTLLKSMKNPKRAPRAPRTRFFRIFIDFWTAWAFPKSTQNRKNPKKMRSKFDVEKMHSFQHHCFTIFRRFDLRKQLQNPRFFATLSKTSILWKSLFFVRKIAIFEGRSFENSNNKRQKNDAIITKTSSDPHPLFFPREARRKFFVRARSFLVQRAATHTLTLTLGGA